MRWITFVIHVQRSTPKRYRPIIHNRTQFRCHFLTHQPGKCGGLLSIKIRFKSMANCFVQKNAWPPGAENHLHRSRRRFDCAELEYCLPSALARNGGGIEVASKNVQRTPAASSLITRLPAAIF